MRAVDLAHAADAEQRLHRVRAELPPDDRRPRLVESGGNAEARGARLAEALEQRLDLPPQCIVSRAQLGDCRRPFVLGASEHGVPDAIDFLPAIRRHRRLRRTLRERPEQPGAGGLPVALDGLGGDVEDVARFFEREAAEETQLCDPALARVERRQTFERHIEIQHVDARGQRDDAGRIIQRHACRLATALPRVTRPGAVHEDASHHLRGDGEKLRAVLPVRAI